MVIFLIVNRMYFITDLFLRPNFQVAQNRAARLMLYYSFQVNVIDMHRTLSWLLVKDKLHLRMLVYFYKVIKYHTPCFFSEKLVNVGFRHDFGTCQASKAQLFLACPHHT